MLYKVLLYDLYIYVYDGCLLVGLEIFIFNVIGMYEINIFFYFFYIFL